MCIRKGTSRIACFGNAIQADWRTTGVCTIQTLATTDQISLYLESGGSNDCIQVKMLLEKLVWSVQMIFSGDKLALQSHVCPLDPGVRLIRTQEGGSNSAVEIFVRLCFQFNKQNYFSFIIEHLD